jgi:hypothetical protein
MKTDVFREENLTGWTGFQIKNSKVKIENWALADAQSVFFAAWRLCGNPLRES